MRPHSVECGKRQSCRGDDGEVAGESWYLACAAQEGPTVTETYRKRAWIEAQNRDLKSGGGGQIHHCHLATARAD